MEIFKTIESFPDYEISNFGRVRTKKRKVRYTHSVTKDEFFRQTECRLLKIHHNNRTGYKFCQLYLNKKMYNKTIHRLVAIEFVPNPNNFNIVNHKDGIKHNVMYDNLEWVTDEYNHEHATNTCLKAKGEEIRTSKLNNEMVHAIKWFLNKGINHSELSKAFKISRPTITLIANNKTWKHIILTGKELKNK